MCFLDSLFEQEKKTYLNEFSYLHLITTRKIHNKTLQKLYLFREQTKPEFLSDAPTVQMLSIFVLRKHLR